MEGSRFTSVMKALHQGLQSRFMSVWTVAFDDEHVNDPAYRGDRLAILSAAFDPQTWCLDLYLSPDLATRARAHLKTVFMEEYDRQQLAAGVAEGNI